MEEKSILEKVITNIVKSIFLIIILYLATITMSYSCTMDIYEYTSYNKDSIIKNIIYILIGLFICNVIAYFKTKFKNKNSETSFKIIKNCAKVIAMACIIFSLIWVFSTKLEPRADQYYVLQSAKEIIEGNPKTFEKTGYLYVYPNQSGIVLFMTFLSKIFGTYNYVAIQILNIIALVISYYFLYKSYEFVFDYKKEEKNNEKNIILISLFIFIQLLFYATFVYGNIFGLMFSLIAIYFELSYFKREKGYKIAISLMSIVIASIIKMNYLVTMIAMIILLLHQIIFRKKYQYLYFAVGVIIFYLFGTMLVEISMEKLSNKKLTNGIPMLAWIEMGLQENGYAEGWYNGYVVQVYANNDFDTKKTKKAVKEDFKETLTEYRKDLPRFGLYMSKKIISQWTNPTFQCFWINRNRKTEVDIPKWAQNIIDEKGAYNFLVLYMDFMEMTIFFGTLMYIVIDFKNIKFENLTFAIIFIGGFLFHILWEAKCQYTITYFVLIIPYAVKGYSLIIEEFTQNFEKNKKTINKG